MRDRLTQFSFAAAVYLCVLVVHVANLPVASADEVRTWTDRSGKFSVEATLVDHNSTSVRLRRQSGEVVEVPLTTLSDADRQYLSRMVSKRRQPERSNPTESESSRPASSTTGGTRAGNSRSGSARAGSARTAAAQPRGAAAAAEDLGTVAERAGNSVVAIMTDEPGGSEGLGSGFVIKSDGLIATNFHVVSTMLSGKVKFRDGTSVDIEGVVAVEPRRDLAIIKVARLPAAVKPLPLGPDSRPAVTSPVIAIGHPRGYTHTVSTGIVNAVRTTEELPESAQAFLSAEPGTLWIQTDAVITNGSSGGPILDSQGRVIGVATWILQGQQMGFAVHSSHLRKLVGSLSNRLAFLPLPIVEVELGLLNPPDPAVFRVLESVASGSSAPGNDERPQILQEFRKLIRDQPQSRAAIQALVIGTKIGRAQPARPTHELIGFLDDSLSKPLMDERLLIVLPVLVADLSDRDEVNEHLLEKLVSEADEPHLRASSAYLLQRILRIDEASDDDLDRREELLDLARREGRGVQWNSTSIETLAQRELGSLRRLRDKRQLVEQPFKAIDQQYLSATAKGTWRVFAFLPSENDDSRSWLRELELIHHHRPPASLEIVAVVPQSRDQVKQLQRGRESWTFIADSEAAKFAADIGAESVPEVYVVDTELKVVSYARGSVRPKIFTDAWGSLPEAQPAKNLAQRLTAVPINDRTPLTNFRAVPLSGNSASFSVQEGIPGVQYSDFPDAPTGKTVLGDVEFDLQSGGAQLQGHPGGKYKALTPMITLPVDQKFDRIALLNGTRFQIEQQVPVARLTLLYEDGKREEFDFVYGVHMSTTWAASASLPLTEAKVGWGGGRTFTNRYYKMYVVQLINPRPDKVVKSMMLSTLHVGPIAPVFFGITLMDEAD